jgi:transcriptional regulator with XRE-family HTH domain
MNNLKKIRKEKNITITELSQKIGMSQANLTKIENNQIEMKKEVAQKIASALNISISSLISTTDTSTIELINPEQYLLPEFSRWNVSPNIDTTNSKGYIMPDDTMSPTISKNSICIVNTSNTNLQNGLFLIKNNETIVLRRLQQLPPNNILILTDNKSYQHQEISLADLNIIGKITHVISTVYIE